MAEGNKYGFGGIGAGGGIANLVAAPKVNPIRSGQFAPTPQRSTRVKTDPKKTITGALLGAASPFLAEAGLAGLGKIPGLEGLLYKDTQATKDDLGVTAPTLGLNTINSRISPESNTSSGFDPYELEQKRLRDRVKAALPMNDRMLPRQKTLLGEGLSKAFTYAPALALGSDEEDISAVNAFIKSAGEGSKVESALDKSRLDNYLRRQTARDTALTKDIDLTRSITYGAYLDPTSQQVQQIKRDVLTSKDGSQRYVISNGDINIDKYVDENGKTQEIPKGQAYFNRNLSLDDADIPSSQKNNYIDANNQDDRALGTFYPAVMQADGTRKPMFIIEDPNGGDSRTLEDWKKAGRNWILDSPGIEGAPLLRRGKSETGVMFDELNLQATQLNGVLGAGHVVLQIAKNAVDSGDKQVFTKSGRFLNSFALSLNNEVDSINKFVSDTFGQNQTSLVKGMLAKKNSGNVMSVFAAANNHARAYQTYQTGTQPTQTQIDADNQLISALARLEQSTSGGTTRRDGSLFSFGNKDQITNNVVNRGRLIAAQIRLAYSAAAAEGQTGRTLSDKDVANFLEQVGYESTVPEDVGTRTAEFIATALKNSDQANPVFSELASLSRSNLKEDRKEFDQRLVDLFRIDRKKLKRLSDKNSDGVFTTSEEEAEELVSSIRSSISENSNRKAPPFIKYDPKTRRFRYMGFAGQFRKSSEGDNPDFIATEYMKPGGYFDTFNINKNNFILNYQGNVNDGLPTDALPTDASDPSGALPLGS